MAHRVITLLEEPQGEALNDFVRKSAMQFWYNAHQISLRMAWPVFWPCALTGVIYDAHADLSACVRTSPPPRSVRHAGFGAPSTVLLPLRPDASNPQISTLD